MRWRIGQDGFNVTFKVLTFKVLLLLHLATGTHALCPGLVTTDGWCIFTIQPQTLATWDAAQRACAARSGTLVVVTSEERDVIVRRILERNGMRRAWIGLREEDTPWYWVRDGRLLRSQGCYKAGDGDPDFVHGVDISAITHEKCMFRCSQSNYMYAGLKRGQQCYCGNTYGKHGTSAGCTLPCSGNVKQKCGAENAYLVLYIQGLDTPWGYDQPNSFHQNQRCGAADNFFGGKLNDISCGAAVNYICEIEKDPDVCSGAGYQLDYGRCYFISEAMLNWFEAREDCRKRGGDLAVMDGRTSTLIQSVMDSRLNLNLLWVGLRKGAMEWVNGERLFYSHWAPSRPNASSPNCATFLLDNVHAWTDELCSRPLPFICQKVDMDTSSPSTQRRTTVTDLPPTHISSTHADNSTTISRTLTPQLTTSTQSINVAVTAANGSNTGNKEPSAGASTGETQISSGQMIIVALCCLAVLLIIAAAVMVFLMIKERKSRSKVGCLSTRSASVPSLSPSGFNSHCDVMDVDTGRILIN